MAQPYRPEDFVHEVESQFLTIEAATFWACEPLLRRFLAEGVAERWLTEQLRQLAGSEDDLGAWQPKEAQVYRGEGWQLSLAVLETPQRFIHLAPYLAFYSPLNGELTVDRYRLPPRFRNDVFDPSMRLGPPERITVPSREILRLDSTQFAYDFQISEPVPVVRFTSRNLHSLQWLFSKDTLQAWQALPRAYQAALEAAAAESHVRMLAKYDAGNTAAMKRLIAQGVQLHPYPPEVLRAAYLEATKYYEETARANPRFRKVYESMRAFRNEIVPWHSLADGRFDSFMQATMRAAQKQKK